MVIELLTDESILRQAMYKSGGSFSNTALTDQAVQNLQVIAVLLLVLVAMILARRSLFRPSSKRRNSSERSWKASPWSTTASKTAHNDMSDPRNQMEAISQVRFERVRLLNKQEARLLPVLEKLAADAGQGHRVMAQTSLGEIIRPSSGDKRKWARANASINSKRLDFAIFNRYGLLVAAVEYQGSGHFHHQSFMRDAVKKEALRKAGVPLIEIPATFDHEDIARQVMPLLADP